MRQLLFLPFEQSGKSRDNAERLFPSFSLVKKCKKFIYDNKKNDCCTLYNIFFLSP